MKCFLFRVMGLGIHTLIYFLVVSCRDQVSGLGSNHSGIGKTPYRIPRGIICPAQFQADGIPVRESARDKVTIFCARRLTLHKGIS